MKLLKLSREHMTYADRIIREYSGEIQKPQRVELKTPTDFGSMIMDEIRLYSLVREREMEETILLLKITGIDPRRVDKYGVEYQEKVKKSQNREQGWLLDSLKSDLEIFQSYLWHKIHDRLPRTRGMTTLVLTPDLRIKDSLTLLPKEKPRPPIEVFDD